MKKWKLKLLLPLFFCLIGVSGGGYFPDNIVDAAQHEGPVIGSFFLKNLIARPRPFIVDPSIELIVKAPKTFSFPSGHTSISFALALSLIYADCPKYWKRIGLAFAIIIGFLRLYMRIHFPIDVLFGIVLGFTCSYFSKIINRFL